MRADVLVLGAGAVGTCAALELQSRGLAVALVDRHAAPACETSYGNAGLIERSSLVPIFFPRDIRALARYALNRAPDARYHPTALPALAPWLYAYWRSSAPTASARIIAAARPLIERSLEDHLALARRAGVERSIRRTGWLKVYRNQALLDAARRDAERLRAWGLTIDDLDPDAARALEPALVGPFRGALHFRDTASTDDPQALIKAYEDLFRRLGGVRLVADARRLESAAGVWRLSDAGRPIEAPRAVAALGPWSGELLAKLGLRAPLAVKRGYHIHLRPDARSSPNRPIYYADGACVITPMAAGLRLTTGVEFARRDARPTPDQADECEVAIRSLLALGPRMAGAPWLGARPCLPDMLPVIGAAPGHPGLWLTFGHQHHGLTLAAVSARLLGAMMTGETPFTDPAPYSIERFRT